MFCRAVVCGNGDFGTSKVLEFVVRTVQAGALAMARKELLDAQAKVKELQEANLKLDSECDTIRQQIASKDLELNRSAACPSPPAAHDPGQDNLQPAKLTVQGRRLKRHFYWWISIEFLAVLSQTKYGFFVCWLGVHREFGRKEQLERDIADARAQIEARTADIRQQQSELRTAEQRIIRMEQTIKEQQARHTLTSGF